MPKATGERAGSNEQAGRRLLERLAGCHPAGFARRVELMKLKQPNALSTRLDQQVQALMRRGANIYALAEPDVRRQLTQAFIAKLEIDTGAERVILASAWREINQAAAHLRRDNRATRTGGRPIYKNEPRPSF